MRLLITLIWLLTILPIFCSAQITKSNFIETTENEFFRSDVRNYELDFDKVYSIMPGESTTVELPNPNGNFDEYVVVPTKVIADDVAKYYSIKTYKGYKKSDKSTVIALDATRSSFNATVVSREKSFAINKNDESHFRNIVSVKYTKGQFSNSSCGVDGHSHDNHLNSMESIRREMVNYRNEDSKKVYRMAIAATGEYSQKFGGTPFSKTNVLNSLASGLNIANMVFNRDLGIEMQLVSTPDIIFEDPATDPYYNEYTRLRGNDKLLDEKIGRANYDLGHVVKWSNQGGVTYIGVLCTSLKGAAFSSHAGDFEVLWMYFFAHEVGHQLGAEHSFSATECRNSTAGNRFEPGAGSSIMSYSFLCGSRPSYAERPDFFYHPASIEQIEKLTAARQCGVDEYVNNDEPIADAGSNIVVPKGTPFILVGDVIDESKNVSYQWEQHDGSGSASTAAPNCNNSTAALFRFRAPSNNNYREFPKHKDFLEQNNENLKWEALPCVARDMSFALIGRDNDEELGKQDIDLMNVKVSETGPFIMTSFNSGEVIQEGSKETVTWEVAGTDSHTPKVDILLSRDNGHNYEVLADNIENDGSHEVIFPQGESSEARILVRSHVPTVAQLGVEKVDQFRTASTFYAVSEKSFFIEAKAAPVVYRDLKASIVKEEIDITWITVSEENNKGFSVQKLVENEWENIGFVNGNGTKTSQSRYNFHDKHSSLPTYYRLEQEDFDGTKSYSKVLTISDDVDATYDNIVVYSNYEQKTLEIKNNSHSLAISLYDLQGREVLSRNIDGNASLDISSLHRGVYVVSYNLNSLRYSVKIVL